MALIRQRSGMFGNHPVLLATTAATGGVLLGAYVAVQIFAAPVPDDAKVQATAPLAEVKPPVKPIERTAETTGSAPAKDDVVSADRCDGQTWPYLTRECIERMQKNRPARVVTTDRAETPAQQTPAASQAESVAASAPPPAAEPAPKVQAAAAASAPEPSQDAKVVNEPPSAPKSTEKSAQKRKIKQAKQRENRWDRARKNRDEGERALAGIDRSDEVREGGDDERIERIERMDRTERRGRRVIVVERGDGGAPRSSGGPLGTLFGGLFGGD